MPLHGVASVELRATRRSAHLSNHLLPQVLPVDFLLSQKEQPLTTADLLPKSANGSLLVGVGGISEMCAC